MSPDDNKAILHAYVETIFNQKQLDRAGELVASDYVDHAALPGQAPGLEGAKPKWAIYLAGIPDLRVTIEELVAEGDKVAVRRSYAGTHRGELLGIPPTGKQVRIGGISIFRLTEGKIAEQWEQLDRLALLQPLRRHPGPGRARLVNLPQRGIGAAVAWLVIAWTSSGGEQDMACPVLLPPCSG